MLLTFYKCANLKAAVVRSTTMLVSVFILILSAQVQAKDVTMADVVREADAGNYEVASK